MHGYRAPVPHRGGTGIGYWHADKQKWLLWEPDPLPAEKPTMAAKQLDEWAEVKPANDPKVFHTDLEPAKLVKGKKTWNNGKWVKPKPKMFGIDPAKQEG